VEGKTVTFKDGTSAEVDAIIICTGYIHHYPYLEDSLRLTGPNTLYPADLYKGTLWLKGGNNKMMYVGAQDQYYSMTLFDVEACWAVKYMLGKIKVPEDQALLVKEANDYLQRLNEIIDKRDYNLDVDYQTAFMADIQKDCDYGYDLTCPQTFKDWEGHKVENVLTFRDQAYPNIWTGKPNPVHHTPWFSAMDDSFSAYFAREFKPLQS